MLLPLTEKLLPTPKETYVILCHVIYLSLHLYISVTERGRLILRSPKLQSLLKFGMNIPLDF